jgi:hypothetical protein
MSVCVVVQTCDLYEPYWRGLWHFMQKQWDFEIRAPIRMFNEEKKTKTPSWCTQTAIGQGTFVENLKKTISMTREDHIFLMLEDFWPIAPMTRKMFDCLYEEFKKQELDALQVSNYSPYYSLKHTGRTLLGRPVFDFCPKSEWIFNFQARFWKKDSLLRFLEEPQISERAVGSAITAEMAADQLARSSSSLKASLFHYLWYPLSGVAYRGKMTEFGSHLQNIVEIESYVDQIISRPDEVHSRPECSV